MNYDNILESINNLAPLSDALNKIQKLFLDGKEDLNINKLIQIIESDAVISVNILKMANSPLYGFSNKISSVSQAVTLFGIMQVYGFLMRYMIEKNIESNTQIYSVSNKKFNDVCNIQSSLLLQWYSKIDQENAKYLAPLALIMETGKLIVANEVSKSAYEEEFKKGIAEEKSIVIYEKNLLNKTSYDISSDVFNYWHMEPLYSKILKNMDEESISQKIQLSRDILKVIITAVNVKSVLSKESVLNACVLVEKMGENPNDFVSTALNVKKAYVNGI